jgi:hypothetical protein
VRLQIQSDCVTLHSVRLSPVSTTAYEIFVCFRNKFMPVKCTDVFRWVKSASRASVFVGVQASGARVLA